MRILILSCQIIALSLVIGCTGATNSNPAVAPAANMSNPVVSGGTSTLFEQAWTDFDQNYSYFIYKKIDWNAIKAQYSPQFSDGMDGERFAAKLGEMLNLLHDWHVYVTTPSGQIIGYNTKYPQNYTSAPRNRYAPKGYQKLGNVIWHGWLASNIAYIRVDSLSNGDMGNIGESDIDALFAEYSGAVGLIIDIRPNNGGNENYAMMFASHCTTKPVVYGYSKTRQGSRHEDFAPMQPKTVNPAPANVFTGSIVCLVGQRDMSSAEWFTLMLRACGAKLVGDRTRGASGNPKEFSLGNGVKYTISTWVAFDANQQEFEDKGIVPDVAVDPNRSFDGEHDYVLEKGLEVLGTGKAGMPAASTIGTESAGGGSDDPFSPNFDPLK